MLECFVKHTKHGRDSIPGYCKKTPLLLAGILEKWDHFVLWLKQLGPSWQVNDSWKAWSASIESGVDGAIRRVTGRVHTSQIPRLILNQARAANQWDERLYKAAIHMDEKQAVPKLERGLELGISTNVVYM